MDQVAGVYEVLQVSVEGFQDKVQAGLVAPMGSGRFAVKKVTFDVVKGLSDGFRIEILKVELRARVPLVDENFVTVCTLADDTVKSPVGHLLSKNVIGQDVDHEDPDLDLLFPITPAICMLAWLCRDRAQSTSVQLQVLALYKWPEDLLLYNHKVSPLLVPLLQRVFHSAAYFTALAPSLPVPCQGLLDGRWSAAAEDEHHHGRGQSQCGRGRAFRPEGHSAAETGLGHEDEEAHRRGQLPTLAGSLDFSDEAQGRGAAAGKPQARGRRPAAGQAQQQAQALDKGLGGGLIRFRLSTTASGQALLWPLLGLAAWLRGIRELGGLS